MVTPPIVVPRASVPPTTRRRFLQACGLSGLGGSAAFGCEQRTRSTSTEVDEQARLRTSQITDDQVRFLREVGGKFAGTSLRVIGEDTPPSVATRALVAIEFTALTGIHVEWEQTSIQRVAAAISADTTAEAGVYDIMYLGHSWLGRFARETLDPRMLFEKPELAYPDYRFTDILAPLVEHTALYQGNLVGIPYDIPIFILMYRRDIFEKLGLSVPVTCQQYLETAQIITRAMAPAVYGTTGMLKLGHISLQCHATAWLWAHGGSFYGANGTSVIDDQGGSNALHYLLQLAETMPPEATTYDWYGEAKSFREGKAAMYISFGEYFPSFDDPRVSKIVGLAEAAPCPRADKLRSKADCGFEETPGMSYQGGSCLAISRYSKHADAAWLFLQWATSADVTTRANLIGGGGTPIRQSTFDDPRTIERARVMPGTSRHFDVTRNAIINTLGSLPHLPRWPVLATTFSTELGRMLTRQQSPEQTLQHVARAANSAASVAMFKK